MKTAHHWVESDSTKKNCELKSMLLFSNTFSLLQMVSEETEEENIK